jgi:hypothetical protein
MFILALRISDNTPEFSNEEIDRQIAEFERELAEHQQHQEQSYRLV